MVLLAQIGSGAYKALLFLHIVAVIVALAPAVVRPLTGPRLLKEDEGSAQRFAGVSAANQRTVHLPALLVAGILGFALVGASDGIKFSDLWVSVAALLWLVIGGLVGAVIVPGERQTAAGDKGAESKVAAAGGIVSLLYVVVVFLMVVQPG